MALNTITLEQAQEWAQNWNNNKITFFETRDLKAFAIPRQVIDDVTRHPDVVDVRTYLGLDEDFNPHLMIVGVNEEGNDLINPEQELYIYNFARPCPTYCPGVAPFING